MSKIGKIKKIEWLSEWKGTGGTLQFHNVWLDDDGTPFNIGAKEKLPSYLAVGSDLGYEFKDESKRTIKRVKIETPAPAPSYQYQPSSGGGNKTGIIVGAALNQAALLIAHGKVDIKDLKTITKRLIEVGQELEEEFKK